MREGEIRLINLDPAIGAEIKKTRPAVIVSKDEVGVLPLKVIVPVTEWKPQYDRVPWMVRLGVSESSGLTKPSVADAFQVRCVSQRRFVRKIGNLYPAELQMIPRALGRILDT